MLDNLVLDAEGAQKSESNNHVVRLKTSYWYDHYGVYRKTSIKTLKRASTGYQILSEDACSDGADSVMTRIVNLDTCPDGLYTVTSCNASIDRETGAVDDYDYMLVPYDTQRTKGTN